MATGIFPKEIIALKVQASKETKIFNVVREGPQSGWRRD